jgi:hypothetical protein
MADNGVDPGYFVDVFVKLTRVELVATIDFARRKAARKRRW